MSDTPLEDILKGEAEEEPSGPTEEARRKKEERLRAIRAEIEAQRYAERRAALIAKGLVHECEGTAGWYTVERSDIDGEWRLEDGCEVCVTISFCPFCGVKLDPPKEDQ